MTTAPRLRIALDGLPLQVRSAGVATYAAGLLEAMARLEPATEFVVFGPRGLRTAAAVDLAWPASVSWTNSLWYPLVMGHPWEGLRHLAALERAVPAVDLFHATAYAVPRTRRTPVVLTVYDLTLLRWPELGTPALRRVVRRTAAAAAAARCVIAISEATRRDLVDLCGIAPAKTRVVHLGCAPRFQPMAPAAARDIVRTRYGLSGSYILHVGTIEPRKNLPLLLRAYARLRAQGRVAHELVLAGEPAWGARAVASAIDACGLGACVRLTGRVPGDDLPALYGAADLFLYPSLYEGFGLPPLEAMACGTPVIASRAGALPEVVGDAARLIDPNDEAGLAAAIGDLLDDPGARSTLRERGAQRARQFSWERCARETLGVYREVLAATVTASP